MATTLLVPGLDGGGKGHWLTWLEAAIPDTQRVTPPDLKSLELPEWSAVVRWHLSRCDEPAFIIAHGFGCLAAVSAACDFSHRVEAALLVAPFDPDNLRLAYLMPEQPLSYPATVVASTNDPHMRLSKAAFWANFWSCEFVNAGRVGGIDQAAGFGAWPAALSMIDELKRAPARNLAAISGAERSHLSRAI